MNISTLSETVHFGYKAFEPVLKFGHSASKVTRTVADALESNIPGSLCSLASGTKILYGIGYIYAVPQCFKQVRDTLRETSPTDIVIKVWKSVISFSTLLDSFDDTISALKAFKIIDPQKLTWTAKVAAYTGPIQMVDLFFSTLDYAKNLEFYRTFSEEIPLREKPTPNQLLTACRVIVSKADLIKKNLHIGDYEKIVEIASEHIWQLSHYKRPNLKPIREFLAPLRQRAKLSIGLQCIDLILSVAKTAISILTASISQHPVFLVTAVVIYSIGFLYFSLCPLMLNPDPFWKPGDVWYEKGIYKMNEIVCRFV